MRGFWRTYFGYRASPFDICTAATVTSAFYGFAPRVVQRAIPGVWDLAPPDVFLRLRSTSAATALRRVLPEIEELARSTIVTDELATAATVAPGAGHALYAANRTVDVGDDPVERFWQMCTTLREHRGDGHIAALVTAGLTPPQALGLFAATTTTPASMLQESRGWTDLEWADGNAELLERGLTDAHGATAHGRAIRTEVEAITDTLAAAPFDHLSEHGRRRLLAILEPPAHALATTGLIPFPNLIGLDQV